MTVNFSNEEIVKLKNLMSKGLTTYNEVHDLKENLKEKVNELAGELDVKPALLNRAIRAAFKSELEMKQMELSDIGEILHITGYQ